MKKNRIEKAIFYVEKRFPKKGSGSKIMHCLVAQKLDFFEFFSHPKAGNYVLFVFSSQKSIETKKKLFQIAIFYDEKLVSKKGSEIGAVHSVPLTYIYF